MLALLLSVAVWAASPAELREGADAFRSYRVGANPVITQQEYEKALSGKVATGLLDVEGFAAKKGYGVYVAPLSIESLWLAINDDRGKVKWTKLSYAEVYEGRYCAASRRVFQFLPVPLVTDRWWVLDINENAKLRDASKGMAREAIFKSVKEAQLPTETMRERSKQGMPVEFVEGAWYLHSFGDNSTLIEYYTWSDPGGAVPARLASSFSASSIEDAVLAMVSLATEGSTCTATP
jgi:hypothetical protein